MKCYCLYTYKYIFTLPSPGYSLANAQTTRRDGMVYQSDLFGPVRRITDYYYSYRANFHEQYAIQKHLKVNCPTLSLLTTFQSTVQKEINFYL